MEQLLEAGQYDVTVFDIRDTGMSQDVKVVVGDLRNPAQVDAAVEGVAVVFHVATAAPSGENSLNKSLMYSVNVEGTRNVLDACVRHHVPRLVYTSSASVVFQGRNLDMVDETCPVAEKPMDYYTQVCVCVGGEF